MAFEDWSEKKKISVTAGIGGVVVVATWVVFAFQFRDLSVQRAALEEQQKTLEDKTKEVEAGQKAKLIQEKKDISREYEKRKGFIPPEAEIPVFLTQDLFNIIRNSTLGRHEFNIKEGKVSDPQISGGGGQVLPYKRKNFTLTAHGTYNDALNFLNLIEEHFPKIVNVEKIDMTVNSGLSTGEVTMLDLNFDFYLYYETRQIVPARK